MFHTNIWFFIVIGLLVLFVSAGIIVMSFRGSIGYAGICMRVLVYDLIVIACIVF